MNLSLKVILGVILSSFTLTIFIEKFCAKFGIFDFPGERKLQNKPIPRLGGLSFLLLPLIGCLLLSVSLPWSFGVGAFIIFLGGFYDDVTPRNTVKGKIYFQATGVLLFVLGLDLTYLGLTQAELFALKALSAGFVFVIVNSANLMDNMNGLTAGLSMIVLGSAAYLADLHPATQELVIPLILIVLSVCGFYFRNFPLGKIYMGDQGSQLLGYLISTFLIMIIPHLFPAATTPRIALSITCIAILLLPFIYDTFSVIWIRYSEGRPITHGDQCHLSHRITRRGFSRTQAVLLIKGGQIICVLTVFTLLWKLDLLRPR